MWRKLDVLRVGVALAAVGCGQSVRNNEPVGTIPLAASTDETVLAHGTCKSDHLTIKDSKGSVVFTFSGPVSNTPPGLTKTSIRTLAKINDYFHASATNADEAVVVICDGTLALKEVLNFLYSCPDSPLSLRSLAACSQVESPAGTVSAAFGGTVTLANGTLLSVPPGA